MLRYLQCFCIALLEEIALTSGSCCRCQIAWKGLCLHCVSENSVGLLLLSTPFWTELWFGLIARHGSASGSWYGSNKHPLFVTCCWSVALLVMFESSFHGLSASFVYTKAFQRVQWISATQSADWGVDFALQGICFHPSACLRAWKGSESRAWWFHLHQ